MALPPKAMACLLATLLAAMVLPGCTEPPSIFVVPLQAGSVAEYAMYGSPSGYGFGFGAYQKDGRNSPLFPTSSKLKVDASQTLPLIAPNGQIIEGIELGYFLVGQSGNQRLAKQLVIPNEGVIGSVRDGEQQTPQGPQLTWIHAWEHTGPDFLLSIAFSGQEVKAGAVEVSRPSLGRSETFLTTVEDGKLHVSNEETQTGPTWFAAEWQENCPFPQSLRQVRRDGISIMRLELESCVVGAGPNVAGLGKSTLPSMVIDLNLGGLWIAPNVSLGGPAAAVAWADLQDNANFSTYCNSKCSLLWARQTETTRDMGILTFATTNHYWQWGFAFKGPSGDSRLFVVEYSDLPTRIVEVNLDPSSIPRHPVGITGEDIQGTLDRVAFSLGPSLLEFRAMEKGAEGGFVTLRPGTYDQLQPAPLASTATFSWTAPKGMLGAFPSQSMNL